MEELTLQKLVLDVCIYIFMYVLFYTNVWTDVVELTSERALQTRRILKCALAEFCPHEMTRCG